ncbi:MAG: arginyltransferase [Pseudomonadota bacterium]
MLNEEISRKLGLERGDFYITAPSPCPYLDGMSERKIFSYLEGDAASATNSMLSQRGFRRSQNIIYLPACEGCQACVPVRIVAEAFKLTRSRRRLVSKNKRIERRVRAPRATSEQFSVLRAYLDARHAGGGMADMTVLDYASMIEETAVDTIVIEYWTTDDDPRLVACALTDRLIDGLSMVYSFFDPELSAQSLGQYMILDHVAFARQLGLPFVYLGYWVAGSDKMAYKQNFQPLEKLTQSGWARMDARP